MSQQEVQANLSNLFLSIGSAAAMHLGMAPHPQTNEIKKDLKLAKFNIDLLLVLEEKTKGHLSDEEKKLLTQLISDLQMNFVKTKN